MARETDLIIVGGGLAGGLAALALAQTRPELKVTLVEPGARLGGNHLWSFFDSDVAPADRALVDPLVTHRWDGYDVVFPGHRRTLAQPYRTIESEALDAAVRAGPTDIVTVRAVALTPNAVKLDDGRALDARAVLDARGLSGPPAGMRCGWQKFVGRALIVDGGHGLTRPVVMDAAVDQSDGYRFVYLLPFDAETVFVEDTYYADAPVLDEPSLSARIDAYAASKGWRVTRETRREAGVLPVVMGGDFDAFWPADDPVARAGVRAGLFHQLTSYSLPDAVRFARWLAEAVPMDGAALGEATRARAIAHCQRQGFERMLARMLFRAAAPAERYRILERFYRLPDALIARFYAGQSTLADRLRILAGKPPVPLTRALRAIMEPM